MTNDAPRLDIVGGGYDHLAPLTAAGAAALRGADCVIHPPAVHPALVGSRARRAELVALAPREGLRAAADRLRRQGGSVAVLVPDVAIPAGLLRKAVLLEGDGFRVGVHPSVPLAEAALLKSSLAPGQGPVAALSGESLEECAGGRWVCPVEGAVTAVGFDGSVLWPARQLDAGRLATLAEALLPEGILLLFKADAAAERGPCPGLAGRGVAVTRAAGQSEDLILPLLARGASPFLFPTISLESADPEALRPALSDLSRFQGVILTSSNAADRFLDALAGARLDLRSLAGRRLYAVGTRTAAALTARGLSPDAIPADFRAEGLLSLLETEGVAGRRFLVPRAEEARETLVEGIRRLGGEAEVVPLYRTVAAAADPETLLGPHRAGMVDAVTFTSGSTFRNFLGILGEGPSREVLSRACVACIGPVVAEEVRAAGFDVAVVPDRATVEDLVLALENRFVAAGRPPARRADT